MDKVRQIENYLDGNLSKEELLLFEKQFQADEELRKEVSLAKEVNETIKEDDVAALRTKLKKLISPKKSINLKTYLSIAASVALLLSAIYTTKHIRINTPKALYNSFYNTYTADFTKRSAKSPQKNSTEFGLLLYEKGEFEEAYHVFQNYLKENYTNQTIKFFAAVSAIETNRTDEAIKSLSEISTDEESLLKFNAKWYLALAYMKKEDLNEAKKLLLELAETPNDHRAKANELLGKSLFKKIN